MYHFGQSLLKNNDEAELVGQLVESSKVHIDLSISFVSLGLISCANLNVSGALKLKIYSLCP